MSIGSITGSGSTSSLIDAIRVWRAGAVTASQAVSNQLDPRGFAQVEEQSSAQRRQRTTDARGEQTPQRPDAGRPQDGGRQPPSGPSSAFIAQFLAQSQETPASQAAGTAILASASYSQASALASAPAGEAGGVEGDILPPSASASSSRGIDLVA